MKKLQVNDSALGGVIVLNADMPFSSANGKVQIDFSRAPSTYIIDEAALRVVVDKTGNVALYVRIGGVWSRVENGIVPGANHISVRRMDIFVWEVSITSGTDTALSRRWHVDYQGAFLTVPLGTDDLRIERTDTVSISVYATGNNDLANLDIRAEKNVW